MSNQKQSHRWSKYCKKKMKQDECVKVRALEDKRDSALMRGSLISTSDTDAVHVRNFTLTETAQRRKSQRIDPYAVQRVEGFVLE